MLWMFWVFVIGSSLWIWFKYCRMLKRLVCVQIPIPFTTIMVHAVPIGASGETSSILQVLSKGMMSNGFLLAKFFRLTWVKLSTTPTMPRVKKFKWSYLNDIDSYFNKMYIIWKLPTSRRWWWSQNIVSIWIKEVKN